MSPTLDRVLHLEVPLIVVIGERQSRLADVVSLVPGSIIELPKRADDELHLLVNNKPVATGYAVKVGENFGIRISYIGDLKARIEALGIGAADGEALPSHAGASAAPAA
ncbi:MAG: FliM/FliN family flagellar motor switch protein [Phycisphaeraceae bacterium]|nr:FliM/FliN family flagellar motor switch protein [Phycisphaeraceae bacterium]